jgi:transposase
MTHFTPEVKHSILLEYCAGDNNHGFEALARRHAVRGGRRVVKRWFDRWDGTPQSLQEGDRTGRPRIVNADKAGAIIKQSVGRANRKHMAIDYVKVADDIRTKTDADVSVRSVRRWGREMGVQHKRAIARTENERRINYTQGQGFNQFPSFASSSETCLCLVFGMSVSADSCEDIADVRRQLQQVGKERLLVLDETHVRLSEAPTNTLVLSGNSPYVLAEATDKYASRFDMIACVNFNQTFSPMILSPTDRQQRGVDGIRTAILIEYITSSLGDEVAALGIEAPVLMLDRATIHSETRIKAAFSQCGVELEDIIKIPTQSAKRLSPLDNALFHDFKEKVRKSCPLSLNMIEQTMITAWKKVTAKQIQGHYRNCGLMRRADAFADCPNPSVHQH